MFKCLILLIAYFASFTLIECNNFLNYRASPKLMGSPVKITPHDGAADVTLNKLDDSLSQISTIYMQALFSGTHSPELEKRMRKLEVDLFDQLDSLYKQERLNDYIKYEAEVTRQMILYNMLKKLFGYTMQFDDDDDNESY